MKHHESVSIQTGKCLRKGDVTKAAEGTAHRALWGVGGGEGWQILKGTGKWSELGRRDRTGESPPHFTLCGDAPQLSASQLKEAPFQVGPFPLSRLRNERKGSRGEESGDQSRGRAPGAGDVQAVRRTGLLAEWPPVNYQSLNNGVPVSSRASHTTVRSLR